MEIKKVEKVKKQKIKNNLVGPSILLSFIYVFRILMIVFWIIAPIMVALTIAFDDGMRNLINYINALIFYNPNEEIYDVGINNTVMWILAPSFWILSVLIILFFVMRPFFKKKSWGWRAYLSFNFIFWSVFLIGIIYAIWQTIPFYKHNGEVGSGESITNNNVVDFYWSALNRTFSPFSGWFIALQCVHGVLFIFGIFSIFEADMLRKMKLDYDVLTVNNEGRSLMNQVLEGRINFGDHEAKDLNQEIKKLKNTLKIEEKEKKIQKRIAMQEERINKKNAKKNKNKKEIEL